MNTILLSGRAKEMLTGLSSETRDRALRLLGKMEQDRLSDAKQVNVGSSHEPVHEIYRNGFRILFSFVDRKPSADQIVLYGLQEWLGKVPDGQPMHFI